MNFKTFKLLSFLTLSLVAIGLTAFKTSSPSKLLKFSNFEAKKWHYYHIISKPTRDSVYCRDLLVHGTCLYAYDDSSQVKELLTCERYVIWFKDFKTSKL